VGAGDFEGFGHGGVYERIEGSLILYQ
jgi:hypothetical protein